MTDGAPARPNVVVVHWHDLGTHLPVYGCRVSSPHVTALAARSTVFDQCFSVSPLCSPARGALWTGRYPHSNGLQGLTHRGWEYHDDEVTLPAMLAAAGYRTALVGLQHEAADVDRLGFTEVVDAGSNDAGDVGALAADWLVRHADDDQPFLLTCGTREVHRDWPEDRYPATAALADVDVPPYLPDNVHTRRDLAAFQAAIEVADRGLGLIMDALARTGLDERTVVVFTTDHGPPFPRAKSTLYDPGVRVALMVRVPPALGGVGPRREGGLMSHVDVVPTLLELAGLPVPGRVQGRSMAPTLLAGAATGRHEVLLEKTFHADYDPMRGIRTSTHKYVRSFEDRPLLDLPPDLEASETRQGMGDDHLAPRPLEELYDLRTDPLERVNVIDDPAQAAVADELRRRLYDVMESTGDGLLVGPVAAPGAAATRGPR